MISTGTRHTANVQVRQHVADRCMESEWDVDRLDVAAYLIRIGYAGPVESTPTSISSLGLDAD